MTTPAKKNTKSKEQVNQTTDKIINRIIHSPTKHHQENAQQLITITPTDNTSPNTELISIIPAHQSTPVEPKAHITAATTQENPKDKTKDNNQLVINKPQINTNAEKTTCDNQLAKQPTKDINRNIQRDTQLSYRDIPEERQDIDELTEIVHKEKDNCDTATPSSISSLNREGIAALDKLFLKPKIRREGSVVEESTNINQAHQVSL